MTSSNGNISALLAICSGNSPVTDEFPVQRLVTRGFDVFFDLRLNKRFGQQSWCWWFETPSRSLRRHCNVVSKVTLPLALWWIFRHYDFYILSVLLSLANHAIWLKTLLNAFGGYSCAWRRKQPIFDKWYRLCLVDNCMYNSKMHQFLIIFAFSFFELLLRVRINIQHLQSVYHLVAVKWNTGPCMAHV